MIKACWFVLILLPFFTAAQQFGGNPSSLKWNQINTDTARIIFPEGLEGQAKRVASIIHDLQLNHTTTIGGKLRKINIVLQNQNTVANAYVGLGPYRSEFYLFPPQNSFELGALNWVDNLSLHEYRHVQQYSNFNVGLSKVAGVIFGQQGQELANAAAVPDWFFEGDAVFNETSLSTQGRGRLPDFFNGYQSLFRQNKNYSYMKLRNGSLRDYTPNHYELGYLLVGYGRQKYGAEFWKNVTQDAARFKSLVYPWQSAVKKYAGISYNQFVSDAFVFYNSKWQAAKGNVVEYLTPIDKNNVVDYKYPYKASGSAIVVLKRSYRKIPAFYKINSDGREERIGTRDISNDDYFSYSNGKIVYSSFKADRRWGYREYSDIKIMDAATGQTQIITSKERFFSPDISHDGLRVISVQQQANQMSNLVMVDLTGKTLFRSKAARRIVYTHPKFSATDSFVYSAVRNEDGKMALVKIELSTGREVPLLPFANRVLGFPTVQGDTIFFSNSYRGSDETWAYIESKKQVYRVAVNPTGYYQAVYDPGRKKLIASNFTADGYRLAAVDQSTLLWQPVVEKENALPDIYIPDALRQENNLTLENITIRDFATAKYSKATNPVNFHSWRPYYDDPAFSVSILGQNILNTFQTELFYTYNRNEQTNAVGATAVYGGWYVQPLIAVNHTWERPAALNRDTTVFYNELNTRAGLQLPLNFSSGKQYRFLTLTGTYNNNQVNWTGLGKRLLRNQSINFYEARVQYSGQIQKAIQHIYPHWAQTLLLQYRSLFNQTAVNQFLASGSVYLPSPVSAAHSIVLTGAYQNQDTLRKYNFSSNFPFSRGYAFINFPAMWRFGANYHLPLLYPDFGIANIVYFKRVRANGFYDYTSGNLRHNNYAFSTVGGELFFDTRWWNQQEVSFGIRYSHLLDTKFIGTRNPNQWEIILPIGLF
ncbi:MAG TPA: hypothetical protein VF623_13510 [Segetibacter sp.]